MVAPMENNTPMKEANKEVTVAKEVITIDIWAAISIPIVRSVLRPKVSQICSKNDGGGGGGGG